MNKFKVGLQLYSVRDKMKEDMDATLEEVKKAGYDCVEFAGFFGKTAKEVKALLEKHSLSCYSVHYNVMEILEEPEKWVEYFKELGIKYYAIPHYSIIEFVNNWEKTVETFKKLAKLLADNGIQLLYHNHDFEFTKVDGECIIDKLYKEVSGMNPQFDLCWVEYAGESACEYLRKYSEKIDVVHFKDFDCKKLGNGPVYELLGGKEGQLREENGFKYRQLGKGRQNWDEIIDATQQVGAEIIIVEQDDWYDDDSMECAKISRDFLRSKGI